MQVVSLQSGSNGNCIYVEAGGVRLLLDAGISGIRAQERLAQHGRDIGAVDAVLISHDHVDHARSMGVFHRKFGLPVYVTAETHRASKRHGLGEIDNIGHFIAGRSENPMRTQSVPRKLEKQGVFNVRSGSVLPADARLWQHWRQRLGFGSELIE